MLDDYLQGTVPQLIERSKLLKTKIARDLPRDYEALIRCCDTEISNIIARLRELAAAPAVGREMLRHARLRRFKRAVADLEHIETRAIPLLNRAQDDDHHVNRLLYRICREINYPLLTPTVATLSTGYFYIDTKLNLMFIPPAEGNFLLHLPDLYHELGHPLPTREDDPILDRFRQRYLESAAHLHEYFADQRAMQDTRRGPRAFRDQIDVWEVLWVKYWLTELFCDLFAAYTLGPAFAWSHLHLFMKAGGSAFAMPDDYHVITHPADDARMCALLKALARSGFASEAVEIGSKWRDVLRLSSNIPPPDYAHCYPDTVLDFIVDKAADAVTEIGCRMAHPDTGDPVHQMLNEAWSRFWDKPSEYPSWEAAAVKALFELCQGTSGNAQLSGATEN